MNRHWHLLVVFLISMVKPVCAEESSSAAEGEFDDILLVVHYNHAYWGTVDFLKELYSAFPNIVFYGDTPHPSLAEAAAPFRDTVIEIENYQGWYFSRVMEDALTRYPNYRGYIFMQDDVMMNYWNFSSLSKDKIWFAVSLRLSDANVAPWNKSPPSWDSNFDKRRAREDLYSTWHSRWWSTHDGIPLVNALLPNVLPKNREIRRRNIGEEGGAAMVCDMFYIPQKVREDAIDLSKLFRDVFCEVAVPSMLVCLDDFENWEILKGFWGYNPLGERDGPFPDLGYPIEADWVHPCKFSLKYFQDIALDIKKRYAVNSLGVNDEN